MTSVICDWLDVTYAPDDVPEPDLRRCLLAAGYLVEYDRARRVTYRYPDRGGVVVITYAKRYGKISLSGGVCSTLRDTGHWLDVLTILSTCPHKVTRLDAAMDVMADAADVISSLRLRYPDGQVSLGRKALPVTCFLSVRPDGRDSGTYYVGHRTSARATARVYDKRLEQLQRFGRDIGHNLTRYEVTARKDYGATLRDAVEPASLFWHIASPALVMNKPKDVAMWEPHGDLIGWQHTVKLREPYELLEQRVEWSAELEALGLVSDEMGDDGRLMLLRLIAKRLGLDMPGLSASPSSVA